MKLANCFVVFGEAMPPQVHLLTESARGLMDDRLRIADSERKRHAAYAATFGTGAQFALPAWSDDCMAAVAQHYTGPHQEQLRGLCAAIALGKPYGPNEPGDERPSDGGTKVPRRPTKPRPTGGAPAFFNALQENAA
jgi:hypothetical protein